MNYAEVCQLKAEAALRGWSGAGDIKNNYEMVFVLRWQKNVME